MFSIAPVLINPSLCRNCALFCVGYSFYFPSLLPTSYSPGPPSDMGNLELWSNLIHTTSMRPLTLSAPELTSGWPRDTDKSCIPRHVWWLRNGHCANVVKVKLHSVKLFQLHIAPYPPPQLNLGSGFVSGCIHITASLYITCFSPVFCQALVCFISLYIAPFKETRMWWDWFQSSCRTFALPLLRASFHPQSRSPPILTFTLKWRWRLDSYLSLGSLVVGSRYDCCMSHSMTSHWSAKLLLSAWSRTCGFLIQATNNTFATWQTLLLLLTRGLWPL